MISIWWTRDPDRTWLFAPLSESKYAAAGIVNGQARWVVGYFPDGITPQAIARGTAAKEEDAAAEAEAVARRPGRLAMSTKPSSTERNRRRSERAVAQANAWRKQSQALDQLYKDMRLNSYAAKAKQDNALEEVHLTYASYIERILRQTALTAFATFVKRNAAHAVPVWAGPVQPNTAPETHDARKAHMDALAERLNRLAESTGEGPDVKIEFEAILHELRRAGFIPEPSMVADIQTACYRANVPPPQRVGPGDTIPPISNCVVEQALATGELMARRQEIQEELFGYLAGTWDVPVSS